MRMGMRMRVAAPVHELNCEQEGLDAEAAPASLSRWLGKPR